MRVYYFSMVVGRISEGLVSWDMRDAICTTADDHMIAVVV